MTPDPPPPLPSALLADAERASMVRGVRREFRRIWLPAAIVGSLVLGLDELVLGGWMHPASGAEASLLIGLAAGVASILAAFLVARTRLLPALEYMALLLERNRDLWRSIDGEPTPPATPDEALRRAAGKSGPEARWVRIIAQIESGATSEAASELADWQPENPEEECQRERLLALVEPAERTAHLERAGVAADAIEEPLARARQRAALVINRAPLAATPRITLRAIGFERLAAARREAGANRTARSIWRNRRLFAFFYYPAAFAPLTFILVAFTRATPLIGIAALIVAYSWYEAVQLTARIASSEPVGHARGPTATGDAQPFVSRRIRIFRLGLALLSVGVFVGVVVAYVVQPTPSQVSYAVWYSWDPTFASTYGLSGQPSADAVASIEANSATLIENALPETTPVDSELAASLSTARMTLTWAPEGLRTTRMPPHPHGQRIYDVTVGMDVAILGSGPAIAAVRFIDPGASATPTDFWFDTSYPIYYYRLDDATTQKLIGLWYRRG